MTISSQLTPQVVVPLTSGSVDIPFRIPRLYTDYKYQIQSIRAIAIGGGAGSASIGIFTSPNGAGLVIVATTLLSSLTAANAAQSLTLSAGALNKIQQYQQSGLLYIRVGASGTNSCAVQMVLSLYETIIDVFNATSAVRPAFGRFVANGFPRDFLPATVVRRVVNRVVLNGFPRDFLPATSAVRVANRLVPNGNARDFLPATAVVRVANRVVPNGFPRDFLPATSAVRVVNRVVSNGVLRDFLPATAVVRVANRVVSNGYSTEFFKADAVFRVANRVVPSGTLV
jgi:hypothetical protein